MSSSLESSPRNSFNIVDILDKYKQHKAILSPLSLDQFRIIVQQAGQKLLQQNPEYDNNTHFIPFKQLNQDAIDELQRSLHQSKNMWNIYSRVLFQDSPTNIDNNGSKELLHNRDAYQRIKKQTNLQMKLQLDGINKEYQKIHLETQGIKSYPSMPQKDQFRQQQIKRQIQMGCSLDLVRQETEQIKQQNELNKSRHLNEIKKSIIYIYKSENNNWNPSAREGSGLINYNDRLYLYGGSGAGHISDLSCATLDKQYYKWNLIKLKHQSQCRSYHSTNVYKNQLIIFGGILYSPQKEDRIHCEVTSEVTHINLVNLETKIIQHAGIVSPRKAHIAEIIGRFLLIQGGIDQRGHYLNDFLSYDIFTQRWLNVEISTNKYPDGIAFHKSCSAIEHKNIDLYKIDPDQTYENQGIYIFGGLDSNGHYLDKLLKIDVRRRPLFIEELEPKGRGPISRCQHSMTYIEYTQQIVIFGGKNDDLNSQGFLNDLHILEIRNCTWNQVEIRGYDIAGRCSHSAAAVDEKLFIFGGVNYSGFLKSDLLVIELNQEKAQDLGAYEAYTERKQEVHVQFRQPTPTRKINLRQQIEEIKKESDKVKLLDKVKQIDKIKRQSMARHSRNLSDAIIYRTTTD